MRGPLRELIVRLANDEKIRIKYIFNKYIFNSFMRILRFTIEQDFNKFVKHQEPSRM